MATTTAAAAAPVAVAAASVKKAPKPLPAPNSDFYQLADVLTAEEKAIVKKVRTYMETTVQPIINKYWSDDAFPFACLMCGGPWSRSPAANQLDTQERSDDHTQSAHRMGGDI